jgi:hypothetical protein
LYILKSIEFSNTSLTSDDDYVPIFGTDGEDVVLSLEDMDDGDDEDDDEGNDVIELPKRKNIWEC